MEENVVLGKTSSGKNIYTAFDLKLCKDYTKQDYTDVAQYFKSECLDLIHMWRDIATIYYPSYIFSSNEKSDDKLFNFNIGLTLKEADHRSKQHAKSFSNPLKHSETDWKEYNSFEKHYDELRQVIRPLSDQYFYYSNRTQTLLCQIAVAKKLLEELGLDTSGLISLIDILKEK